MCAFRRTILPPRLISTKSVKLELGSTAKLRTLTHYLEVVAELHKELAPLDADGLKAAQARDPLTKWAVETLQQEPNLTLDDFLERAMDRKYSASRYETFFTGGGIHHFENFEREDNERILPLPVRDGFRNSTNLVFIRLMRDLVGYHRARLSYSADDVLANQRNPERRRMLQEIAEEDRAMSCAALISSITDRPRNRSSRACWERKKRRAAPALFCLAHWQR